MFLCSTCLQMNVVLSLVYAGSSLLFIKKYFKHCPIWFGSTWRNPLVPGTILSFPYSDLLQIGGQSGATFHKPITWRGNTKQTQARIGHFRVVFRLCFKTSLLAKFFLWKWVWFAWKLTYRWKAFSDKRFHAKTRVDAEANNFSEMACYFRSKVKTILFALS